MVSVLGDLHLNSITVSQVMAETARRLGLPVPLVPTDYANATVAAAQALEQLLHTGGLAPEDETTALPAGVDAWIRPFTIALVERPLARWQPEHTVGSWRVLAPPDHPLAGPLQHLFAQAQSGHGVVLCLPLEPDAQHIELLLEGAQAVSALLAAGKVAPRFILVQHGEGAASFARTLHLELPAVATCIVDVPFEHPQASAWVLAEAMAVHGYAEAHYDASGTRREPVLRLCPGAPTVAKLPLGPEDVLCVTGGGKGIAAECALALARETGARLALLGRSHPATDAELAANLARMAAAGITLRYIPADITDAAAVQRALQDITAAFGPITAVLHGAGTNVPRLLSQLDTAAFQRTLAPKLQGLRHVLAALDPEQLRFLVTFGSIIARTGMHGEADYALANEWLARLTTRFQAEHPACYCLTVEWSVWSGVGMGERLGRIDALRREGITPIPPDVGVAVLQQLLARRLPSTSVVVTGRCGEVPTIQVERPELPFLRFLERPRVFYPGVELVVEADVSTDTDPYLRDHIFQGICLFPAVLGLEAMAQVAMALAATDLLPQLTDVTLSHPVVIQDGTTVTLRIAALVRADGRVDVVLRSSTTAFHVDHFLAVCQFGLPGVEALPRQPRGELPGVDVALDPAVDLYETLLFQGGHFQQLQKYRQLCATACEAVTG